MLISFLACRFMKGWGTCWPGTTIAMAFFLVRSAYKVEVEDKRQNRRRNGQSTSGVSHGNSDDSWKKLWRIKCPKKMLHFLWRLGQNSIALRCNLKRRGMKIDTLCVQCGRFDEDGAHLFFKCKQARHI